MHCQALMHAFYNCRMQSVKIWGSSLGKPWFMVTNIWFSDFFCSFPSVDRSILGLSSFLGVEYFMRIFTCIFIVHFLFYFLIFTKASY